MEFVQILNEIRIGRFVCVCVYIKTNVYRCTVNTLQILRSTENNPFINDGIIATRLCTHKKDADAINEREMNALTGLFVSLFVEYVLSVCFKYDN
jgi:hypothetical protein